MKWRVNWLTFIRQHKSLNKVGWRNLFIFADNFSILFTDLFLFQWRWSGLKITIFSLLKTSCKWALPLQAQSCVGSIASRKNCEACENLAIRRSQIGSVERRTFTFEQQRAQLDFIVQENEFLMWYDTIIIIKVDQKLSDLFQRNHSQTFNKVKKSL